jgi:phenylacetate-coenzyme A ligase PaaK-like adenylate-forming protein
LTSPILDDLIALTDHHRAACKPYANYCDTLYPQNRRPRSLADLPFLPVLAFKDFDLRSVAEADVFKVMMSSGTSGARSRIYIDRETAQLQTRTLTAIFGEAFGKTRSPMLVIDSESTVKDRLRFSARTAAVNGFSIMARDRCFALDDDMSLNIPRVTEFLQQYDSKRIFIFGFTFLVWQAFCGALRAQNQKLPLEQAFLLHGGGWKKLESEKVSNPQFKAAIAAWTGCADVRNYYGMVEQTGTIFMECPEGRLHASAWSDALVRDIRTHQALPHGEVGLIEVFSTIQKSYPGHALLTEDMGLTRAASDCPCGHPGTIVEVHGRLPAAEVRGCSDAYN